MESLDKLLAESLEIMGLSSALRASLLQTQWQDIVGKKASLNSQPVMIRNKILIIATTNPSWSHRLTMMKNEILIKTSVFEAKVEDIRCRATLRAKENRT